MTEKLMTVSEVAELLTLGESTVYRLARRGVIPHIRINGALRFPVEAIQDWIREQTIQVAANGGGGR